MYWTRIEGTGLSVGSKWVYDGGGEIVLTSKTATGYVFTLTVGGKTSTHATFSAAMRARVGAN